MDPTTLSHFINSFDSFLEAHENSPDDLIRVANFEISKAMVATMRNNMASQLGDEEEGKG